MIFAPSFSAGHLTISPSPGALVTTITLAGISWLMLVLARLFLSSRQSATTG